MTHTTQDDRTRTNIKEQITKILEKRIMIFDGAMGSMIQRWKLSENDFRGSDARFAHDVFPNDLKGNNDLLSITKPEIITEIHERYLAAGADIISVRFVPIAFSFFFSIFFSFYH